MTDIPALIQTIHHHREAYIAGDQAAGADLYGYRVQLLRALQLAPRGWRDCIHCGLPAFFGATGGRVCRPCKLEQMRTRSRANHARRRDERTAQMRAYYASDPAAQKARCYAWVERNRERYNAMQRESKARRRAAQQQQGGAA